MVEKKTDLPKLGDTGEWSGGGVASDPSFGFADLFSGRSALNPSEPAGALRMPAGRTVNIGGVSMPESAPIRVQIRQAYLNLTEGKLNQRIELNDIRGQLKHLPTEAVDAELQRLHMTEEGFTLSGEDNQRALNEITKRGALNFKGEPKYYLWINEPPAVARVGGVQSVDWGKSLTDVIQGARTLSSHDFSEKADAVYRALQAEDLSVGDLKSIAKEFTGISAKSKSDALKNIWNRFQSLITMKQKLEATAGRSAG